MSTVPRQKLNLLEERREYSGYWWHPDDPDCEVAGTLIFSREDGLQLRLMGVLNRIHPQQYPPEITTLHGHLIEGDLVTLCKVWLAHHLPRSPGIVTQRFRVSEAVIGAHLKDLRKVSFPSCSFRLSYLEEWLSYRPLSMTPQPGPPPTIDVSVRRLWAEFERVDHLDADVRLSSTFDTPGPLRRSMHIDANAWIVLRPRTSKPLDWYLMVISRIRNLVKLCLSQSTYVEEVTLTDTGNSELTLIYEQTPSARPTDSTEAWPVLQADQLGASFASTISKWMKIHDRIHHSLSVFLVALFGPNSVY